MFELYAETDFDSVISETSFLKPLLAAASNIAIIYSAEIEKYRLHTLGDMLRHCGLFVFSTRDFGTSSVIDIQGMDDPHILILLDGIP